MSRMRSHWELDVYRVSYKLAMDVFELTRFFPEDEKYSLSRQFRNSSRSVAANISEAFRKRRYPKSFIAKLSDAEGEAAESQVWAQFAFDCGYINESQHNQLKDQYDKVIGMLVNMIKSPNKWSI